MSRAAAGEIDQGVGASRRLLQALRDCASIVLATHVNPDPDALASMIGMRRLLQEHLPDVTIQLALDGMIARAENLEMVDRLGIQLVRVDDLSIHDNAALVLVDAQPRPDLRPATLFPPRVVIDHHETPGAIAGVRFVDIRPNVGATSTIVLGYLREQGAAISDSLATALYYGIDSEISGYPREASPLDDQALEWLYPRLDKDLLARIRNPRLPRNYFTTFQYALTNACVYDDVIIARCGVVPHPEIVAELADFFIRFDQVAWALCLGVFDRQIKLSLRSDHIGGGCGDLLRQVLDGLGSAGGHDKRAGGSIPLTATPAAAPDDLIETVETRFLARLGVSRRTGQQLLPPAPAPAP